MFDNQAGQVKELILFHCSKMSVMIILGDLSVILVALSGELKYIK